jgi:hypothetical protein
VAYGPLVFCFSKAASTRRLFSHYTVNTIFYAIALRPLFLSPEKIGNDFSVTSFTYVPDHPLVKFAITV